MKKIATLTLTLLISIVSVNYALDIPLSGVSGGSGSGQKIGYVDMEKIFEIYPQTKAAKEDYNKKREAMREDLANREVKLEELRKRLAVEESGLLNLQSTPKPEDGSEESVPESDSGMDPERITQTKQELDKMESEYEEALLRAQKDLEAFENRQTQIILGRIYEALQDLAVEEQVTLVVDKASILFGDADVDLTEKLSEKVRGF